MEIITVNIQLKMDIKNLINNEGRRNNNNNDNNDPSTDQPTKADQSAEHILNSPSSSHEMIDSTTDVSPRSSPSILAKIHESPKVLSTIMKTKKKGIYKCSHCSKHFVNFLQLAAHYDENGIKKEFHCPEEECPWHVLGLPNRNELNRHIKSQHQPRQFECRMGCDYRFHRADTRNRHEKQVHMNENSRLNKSKRSKQLKSNAISKNRSYSDVGDAQKQHNQLKQQTQHQLQHHIVQQQQHSLSLEGNRRRASEFPQERSNSMHSYMTPRQPMSNNQHHSPTLQLQYQIQSPVSPPHLTMPVMGTDARRPPIVIQQIPPFMGQQQVGTSASQFTLVPPMAPAPGATMIPFQVQAPTNQQAQHFYSQDITPQSLFPAPQFSSQCQSAHMGRERHSSSSGGSSYGSGQS